MTKFVNKKKKKKDKNQHCSFCFTKGVSVLQEGWECNYLGTQFFFCLKCEKTCLPKKQEKIKKRKIELLEFNCDCGSGLIPGILCQCNKVVSTIVIHHSRISPHILPIYEFEKFLPLPKDTINEILNYLYGIDLVNLSLVNKTCYSLTSNDKLWKKKFYSDFYEPSRKISQKIVKKILSQARKGKLTWREAYIKRLSLRVCSRCKQMYSLQNPSWCSILKTQLDFQTSCSRCGRNHLNSRFTCAKHVPETSVPLFSKLFEEKKSQSQAPKQ